VAVAPELQGEVLDRLEAWASAHLGDLTSPRPAVEAYQLDVVDLSAPRERLRELPSSREAGR
jgi:hypothetical protein